MRDAFLLAKPVRLEAETERAAEAVALRAKQAEVRRAHERKHGNASTPPELTADEKAEGLTYARSHFHDIAPEWQENVFRDEYGRLFVWRLISREERIRREREDLIPMTPRREIEQRERDDMLARAQHAPSLAERLRERNRRGTDPLDPRRQDPSPSLDEQRRNPISSERLRRAFADSDYVEALDVDLGGAIPGFRS